MTDLREEDALVFVDVDYYTDMRRWAQYGKVMLLYTFVPEIAAGAGNDSRFELGEGEFVDVAGYASHIGTMVRYQVSGGEAYAHPLWDWSISHFTVVDFWGNRITYLVESRRCPSGRRMVCCFPSSYTACPYWVGVPDCPLRRFDAVHDGISVVSRESDNTLSIGCPGTWECLNVSLLEYRGWMVKYGASGSKYVGDVEKWMRISERPDVKSGATRWAPVVYALLRGGWEPKACSGICGTSELKVTPMARPTRHTVEHYVLNPTGDVSKLPADTADFHKTDVMRAFAPPLVTVPVMAPARVAANARMAHQLRVKDTQNKFADHVFKTDLGGFASEFVRMTVGRSAGTVVPYDLQRLEEECWLRPSQRQGLLGVHTMCAQPDGPLRGFMKGEAGMKPRQIVNCAPDHNAPLGCFVHALMDDVKSRFEWIGCGRTPAQVEARVAAVSAGTCIPASLAARLEITSLTTTHEGDITNCDGSERRWHREMVIEPIIMGLLVPGYRAQMRHYLHNERSGMKVKMSEGYSYETGWELISGTSLTTFKNCLKVAFGDYVALRRSGLDHEVAFACLGVYCGDDSVMVALPLGGLAECRVEAMADLAMDQKLIVREMPDPVSFLGEFHYDAFVGGGTRLPDFWRQAVKVHMSSNKGSAIAIVAANKAAGMVGGAAVHDPLLGPWAEKVLQLAGGRANVGEMTKEEAWKLQNERVVCGNPAEVRKRVRPMWSKVVGIDMGELDSILGQIAAATTLDELPRGVLDNVLTAKACLPGIGPDGALVEPSSAPPIENAERQEETKEKREPRDPGGRRGRGGQVKTRPRPPRTDPQPAAVGQVQRRADPPFRKGVRGRARA